MHEKLADDTNQEFFQLNLSLSVTNTSMITLF